MKDIRSQLPESGPDSLQIAKWIDRYGEEELVTRMEEGHFTAAGFIFSLPFMGQCQILPRIHTFCSQPGL